MSDRYNGGDNMRSWGNASVNHGGANFGIGDN